MSVDIMAGEVGVVAAAAHELGPPLAPIELAATELVDELAAMSD